MRRSALLLACFFPLLTACSHTPRNGAADSEARTANAFLSYSHQSPLALNAFLE